ncbi:CpaF family protein [Aliidiomarina sp. Khilg15.8]
MDWYAQLCTQVRDRINVRQTDIERLTDEQLRALLMEIVQHSEIQSLVPASMDTQHIVQQLLDDMLGLGPLEELLRDTSVSEIMVNRFDEVYVERAGCLSKVDKAFRDEGAVRQVIERIVSRVGRRVDESAPMADARLASGARVNVVLPPLALKGHSITIRKFNAQILSAEDLCQGGACSAQLAAFLKLAVQQRLNIVVSGGTGTGKTTLLNVLANWIAKQERVVTIEDSAELRLNHDNLVGLEARPANQENQGAISIRQLVINALRMRPDRIVVGECRGGESLDMLQAMNTGHAGSLTTLHANTPRDALRRLEVMVMMAGMELPLQAIRQQVSSAIDLIVQLQRRPCGRRVIHQVTEVQGLEGEVLRLADIFVRPGPGADQAISTGDIPMFCDRLTDSERGQAVALLATPAESEVCA